MTYFYFIFIRNKEAFQAAFEEKQDTALKSTGVDVSVATEEKWITQQPKSLITLLIDSTELIVDNLIDKQTLIKRQNCQRFLKMALFRRANGYFTKGKKLLKKLLPKQSFIYSM